MGLRQLRILLDRALQLGFGQRLELEPDHHLRGEQMRGGGVRRARRTSGRTSRARDRPGGSARTPGRARSRAPALSAAHARVASSSGTASAKRPDRKYDSPSTWTASRRSIDPSGSLSTTGVELLDGARVDRRRGSKRRRAGSATSRRPVVVERRELLDRRLRLALVDQLARLATAPGAPRTSRVLRGRRPASATRNSDRCTTSRDDGDSASMPSLRRRRGGARCPLSA